MTEGGLRGWTQVPEYWMESCTAAVMVEVEMWEEIPNSFWNGLNDVPPHSPEFIHGVRRDRNRIMVYT